MATYAYRPLGHRTIRILQLLSGDGNAPLEGHLTEFTLPTLPESIQDDVPALEYECLSYVWGIDKKPFAISINSAPLPITTSLNSLLKRLRNTIANPPLLWIDAICISQNELAEKDLKVALMSDIYRVARRVIVDLGEYSPDVPQALEFVTRAGVQGLEQHRFNSF
ncbi:heterokaryon incompatibility protein-domain-containing protein [Triangularia setosa]|uniref:Heterokaryon incompatibility protein-domain-containing protein n=1 Tax=Triangularia setosa TaxID=2587417 RepID=A0AAN6VZT9_9PEZI|nr:heterokaryon incompatibility protein-domain-containing protein [Podospora setosa]